MAADGFVLGMLRITREIYATPMPEEVERRIEREFRAKWGQGALRRIAAGRKMRQAVTARQGHFCPGSQCCRGVGQPLGTPILCDLFR